jgi:DNA excision repair protein ERCC-2
LSRLDEHASLQKVASFATLVATYEKGMFDYSILIGLFCDEWKGFLLILEPFETDNATVPNPVFHLT